MREGLVACGTPEKHQPSRRLALRPLDASVTTRSSTGALRDPWRLDVAKFVSASTHR